MTGRCALVLSTVACVASMALVAPAPAGAARGTVADQASGCFPTDNGDPAIVGLTITPDAVDVRKAAKSITFTMTVADSGGPGPATGVAAADVTVLHILPKPGTGDLTARQGVRLLATADGTLSGTMPIVRGDRNGLRFVSVRMSDRAGNSVFYSHDALVELGVTSSWSTLSHPDVSAPRMTGLQVSRSVVDTRHHARTVTVTALARDKGTGVRSVRVGFMGTHTSLRKVRGGSHRGTWSGKLRIPKWHEKTGPGLRLTVQDVVGRSAVYTSSRLRRLGFPSAVRVISPVDKKAPTVSITATSPVTLDLRQADGAISFEARAADVSGVRAVRVRMDDASFDADTQIVKLTRVSGSDRNGLWRGTLPLPRCDTGAGKWTVVAIASDRTGHESVAKHAPVVTIDAKDIRPPRAFLLHTAAPVAGPVTVEFGEDVRGLTSATGVVQRGLYSRGTDVTTPTLVPGTWSCSTEGGAAADCAAGPLREARFSPERPFDANQNYSVVLNPEHQLDLTDMSGNPYSPGALGFSPG